MITYSPDIEYKNMKIIPPLTYERKICNFHNLLKAYKNARKLKRDRYEVLYFTQNLEDEVMSLLDDLKSYTYRQGPYRKFCVYEPKLRLISALHFRDRLVQWSIYQLLMPFYDKIFIEDSYACRINKGIYKALDRIEYWIRKLHHLSTKNNIEYYYLKLDISKFFYRIDHRVLINILSKRVKDPRFLKLLRTIINDRHARFGLPRFKEPKDVEPNDWRYDVGMPIGNLTSQLFANLYMNELDQYCKHILKIKYYIRYMDDIVILGEKQELKKLEPILKNFLLEELKLDTNNKTVLAPIRKGMEFVGFNINGYYRRLRKSTSKRMKKYIIHLLKKYDEYKITLEELQAPLISYNGIFKRCCSTKLKNTIFNLIRTKSYRLRYPIDIRELIIQINFPDSFEYKTKSNRRSMILMAQSVEMYKKIIQDLVENDLGSPDYILNVGLVQENGAFVIVLTVKEGTDFSLIPSMKDGIAVKAYEGKEEDSMVDGGEVEGESTDPKVTPAVEPED